MNIAVVHYHLNRGGVTRVIANQLLSLDGVLSRHDRCCVAILFGGRAEGWPADFGSQLQSIALRLCPLAGLDYDGRSSAQPDTLAGELRELLSRLEFSPSDTLLHVHNHNLGKNVSLPGALNRLALDGFPLLLQIHDFAEDFRPADYRLLADVLGTRRLPAVLYPQAAHVHYAVLNRRDQAVLLGAGVDDRRLHLLPNPVPALGPFSDRAEARKRLFERFGISPDERYVLYPVRGIRRKNLGEALLWSALAGQETEFGFTLAPLNPAEQPRYRHWKALASELGLHCHFETGGPGGLAFEENLAAADVILTTSVAEGFGMVFLESWLAGRALTGRNLPEVTADFADVGLRLDTLYDRLHVPVDWIGRSTVFDAIAAAYARVLDSYGKRAPGRNTLFTAIERKLQDGCIDFADLDEPLQERVIRRVNGDLAAREELRRLNPLFERSSAALRAVASGDPAVIERNRQLVGQRYSLGKSGNRLKEVYRQVLSSRRAAALAKPAGGHGILDSFLNLDRFRLIRG